ncbi:MAG: hypothetical protein JO091_01875, partial [Acidobacteriaceae bacterium]|nr:hypothetical protein [Acidobacteriaceae bacterium]
TDAAQNTSIRNLSAAVSNQSAQLSKMIESIEAMSGVVASASQHAAALPAMLKRIGSDLREAGALSLPGKVESRPQPAFSTILTPSTILPAPAPTLADSGAISMGGHHHPPVDDVVAMSNVVVHHNPQGVMDYWLVPRVVAGAPVMTKVVPITQTRMGTFVHNVEEVKDYIVTPSGDWIAAPESNEKR